MNKKIQANTKIVAIVTALLNIKQKNPITNVITKVTSSMPKHTLKNLFILIIFNMINNIF